MLAEHYREIGGHTTTHGPPWPAGLEPVQLGQWPGWWVSRFDPERQELRCHILLEGPLNRKSQRGK